MKKKALIFPVLFLLAVALAFLGHYLWKQSEIKSISSFEECRDFGAPIIEGDPEECVLPDGRSFWGEIKDIKVYCTTDVKECPDGSYVIRRPPECDFDPCPGE